MFRGFSESLGDSILGYLKDEIPLRNDFRYREEKFGYTVFDVKNLKIFLIDKIGFQILNNIDGKKNIKTIIKKVSEENKTSYVVVASNAIKYISNLSNSNIIQLNKPISYKFKQKNIDLSYLNGPNEVHWFITNQCNLKCSHCGNTSRAKLENELSKEESFDFINQCVDLGVFILNVSGGEAFLRENWFEILSYARKKKLEVGITSNGTLIDDKVASQLKKLETFNIHISLDGIGKVHDDFRNQKGVFKSVINSIELFKKYKIPFGLTTSITKKNFHDLENVKNFVKENEINSWNLYYALPVGCLEKADSVSITEYYNFAKKVADYRKELKDITYISIGDSLGYYGSLDIRDDLWMGCRAGISGCAVDAEGNVKGCPIQHDSFNEGNIREKPLKDIWLDKNAFSYNRNPVKLEKHCKTCRYGKVCKGGCKTSMYSQQTNFRYNDYCLYHIEKNNRVDL
jgi:radical SAM protein with 4Fe4S-binding SPASM domain